MKLEVLNPIRRTRSNYNREGAVSRTPYRFMGKIAFLFPGQGSQFAGMGKLLADEYPVARETFQEADDTLGISLSRLCFEGPEDELKRTENTQPALLATSVAAFRVLVESAYHADCVAGHSLGEYSALVAAESISFVDALRLVRKRGAYMQAAVPAGVGAMAALLKLPEEKLEPILQEAAQGEVVSAANLNSPDQVVIAGHAGAVERAMVAATAAGARRAVLLAVSAPFHCPLMKPAQDQLKPDLDATLFSDPKVPLIRNWRADAVETADQAREGLYQQVPNPVRWTDSIRRVVSLGVDRFVEVGAGSVLSGLCRQIDPSLKGARFGEPGDFEKLKDVVG
jgi:[acyl-carrier-protein] S-malonyltransferase